jgi:hypothetical protein
MSSQRPSIDDLARNIADEAGVTDPEEIAELSANLARQHHSNAKQALDQIQTLTSQLNGTLNQLASPEATAGQGNEGWYRHEAKAQIQALERAYSGLEDHHNDLAVWLATRGVQVRPIPR